MYCKRMGRCGMGDEAVSGVGRLSMCVQVR